MRFIKSPKGAVLRSELLQVIFLKVSYCRSSFSKYPATISWYLRRRLTKCSRDTKLFNHLDDDDQDHNVADENQQWRVGLLSDCKKTPTTERERLLFEWKKTPNEPQISFQSFSITRPVLDWPANFAASQWTTGHRNKKWNEGGRRKGGKWEGRAFWHRNNLARSREGWTIREENGQVEWNGES